MSRQIGLISAVGVMCLLATCTRENQTGYCSHSSFDGAWAWYEDGTRVFDVVIDQGEITSLQRAGANARRMNYSSTHCAVSPFDGLIAFSYATPNPESSWVEFTAFRFDLGESCLEFLEAGILPGQRIVDDSDLDDIFMFPLKEVKDGELRLIASQ